MVRALFKDADGEVLRSTWKGKLELILTRDSIIHKENTSDIFICFFYSAIVKQDNPPQQYIYVHKCSTLILMLLSNVIMTPDMELSESGCFLAPDARPTEG